MDAPQGPIEMPDLDTHQLEQPQCVDEQLLLTIDSNIKSSNWIQSHHCITMLRQVIKYYPNFTADIVNRYSIPFVDLFTNGKTQIIKNLLRMVKEIFDLGAKLNLEKAVYVFLPILLKKASTDLGHIKEMSQHVLTSFANNCGYDCSFISNLFFILVASGYCNDKSVQISEIAVKLLCVLVQNVGSSFVKLNHDTLQQLMRNIFSLVDGKRQNLRTQSLDICLQIYNGIGSENYLSLMNYSLKQEEVQVMGNAMETHRVSKQKPNSLSTVLKERRTTIHNQNFNNNNRNYNNNQMFNQNGFYEGTGMR